MSNEKTGAASEDVPPIPSLGPMTAYKRGLDDGRAECDKRVEELEGKPSGDTAPETPTLRDIAISAGIPEFVMDKIEARRDRVPAPESIKTGAASEDDWPDPTETMFKSEEFAAVWRCIKGWDIERKPDDGYCEATGNHVRAILDALCAVPINMIPRAESDGRVAEAVREERERCWRIADDFFVIEWHLSPDERIGDGSPETAKQIAAAIRSQGNDHE